MTELDNRVDRAYLSSCLVSTTQLVYLAYIISRTVLVDIEEHMDFVQACAFTEQSSLMNENHMETKHIDLLAFLLQ